MSRDSVLSQAIAMVNNADVKNLARSKRHELFQTNRRNRYFSTVVFFGASISLVPVLQAAIGAPAPKYGLRVLSSS